MDRDTENVLPRLPSINSIKVKQFLHGPIQSLRGPESDKIVSQSSEPFLPQQLLLSAAELNPWS